MYRFEDVFLNGQYPCRLNRKTFSGDKGYHNCMVSLRYKTVAKLHLFWWVITCAFFQVCPKEQIA